jgi:hypothetical protein
MSDIPQTGLTPAERVDDVSRTLRALRQAVQEALRRHKGDGNPVAVWRNARVEWIPPAEIPDQPESPGSS